MALARWPETTACPRSSAAIALASCFGALMFALVGCDGGGSSEDDAGRIDASQRDGGGRDAATGDGGGSTDAAPCQPACGTRQCGLDPVCGMNCGTCPPGQDCRPDGTCGACTSDDDCRDSPRGRQCDTTTGLCTSRCADPNHCAGHPLSTFVCDSATNACVACTVTADCEQWSPGSGAVCSPESYCVQCNTSADCGGQTCHDNRCVECVTAAECASDEGCSPEGTCGARCDAQDDCPFDRYCDPNLHSCVSCVDDGHCQAGNRCDPTTHQCRPGCITDADCGGGRCGWGGACLDCLDDRDCIGNPDGERCGPDGQCVDCLAQITCDGRICGMRDNGCGATVSCGSCGLEGTCSADGSDCTCPADASESNDTRETATSLGMLTDDPDSATAVLRSIHSDADVDWYTFQVEDSGFLGNPRVTVSIENRSHENPYVRWSALNGSEYDLAVWYTCGSGGDAHTCTGRGAAGSASPDAASALCAFVAEDPNAEITTECRGTDESGTVVVRVAKTSRNGVCDAYSLGVSVR